MTDMIAIPMDPKALRASLGCFATGVTVVTTGAAGSRPIGLTVNSFASLSLDPPLLLWSLSNRSPNRQAFRTSSHFAINVLRLGQEDLAMQFANPKMEDKFEGIEWQHGLTGNGPPLLAVSHAQFVCETRDTIEVGDHTLFIGKVVHHAHDQTHPPLLFYRGQFGRIDA